MLKTLAALALLFSCSFVAPAQVTLFSNNTGCGGCDELGVGLASGTEEYYGLEFSPTTSGLASRIDFWATSDGGDDELEAQIYSVSDGLPGTQLASGTANITVDNSFQFWAVNLSSPVNLSSSSSYFAIFTTPDLSQDGYALGVGGVGNLYSGHFNFVFPGNPIPQFDVVATAPEPATFIPAALGGLALLSWDRKKRVRKKRDRKKRSPAAE